MLLMLIFMSMCIATGLELGVDIISHLGEDIETNIQELGKFQNQSNTTQAVSSVITCDFHLLNPSLFCLSSA